MNLKQIELVVEIAKTRNFTQAAKNLFISQPALSAQIKALEDELGFPLFIRNRKRPIELTEGGRSFVFHAQKVNADLMSMRGALGEFREGGGGEARIGLFLTFGYTCVGKIIEGFRQSHPGIKIFFKIGISSELLDDLKAGVLDVAIVMDSYPGQLPVDKSLSHYLVSQSMLAVIANKNHPLATRSSVSLKDLDGESVLLPSHSSPMRQTLENSMQALDAHPVVIGESSQADAVIQLAASNIGMGFLSMETHGYYNEPTAAIPIYPTISRDVYFVCNRESRNIRWSRMFRDYMVDRLQTMRLETPALGEPADES